MARFKDDTISGKEFLVIVDEQHAPGAKTRLRIYKPLIGQLAMTMPRFAYPVQKDEWSRKLEDSKAPPSWVLTTSHHYLREDATSLPTLGHRIVKGETKWGQSIEFTGEFQYIPGYWEWSEDVLSRCESPLRQAQIYDSVYASLFTYDRNVEVAKAFCEAWCPSTNTLLTTHGEMLISLWDLHVLSGLPVDGAFYDDVVPCTKELVGANQDKKSYLPPGCSHLFHAYHLLQLQNHDVSITTWIQFWSKKKQRYEQPPSHVESKKKRSKLTHNPTGELTPHRVWTAAEEIPFMKLDLKKKYWEGTYLAAFIACWLCSFVLPDGEVKLIRPETFKMASKIAVGERVALTVPVLASIYRGLNFLSKSSDPSSIRTSLPFHFVYSWMACYFKTHFTSDRTKPIPKMVQFSGVGGARSYDIFEARRHVYRGQLATWTCTMPNNEEDISYVDDGEGAESRRFLFVAIRSSYLAKRSGDHFSIEPYSPHRFSHQFGFYQLTPGILNIDFRKASLEDGFKHWRLCMLQKSMSKAYFPGPLLHPKKLVSVAYKCWWNRAYKNFLNENAATLIPSKPNTDLDVQEDKGEKDSLGKRKVIEAPLDGSKDNMENNDDRYWKRKRQDISSEVADSRSGNNCNLMDKAVNEEKVDVLSSDTSKESSRDSASSGRGQTVEVSQLDKSDAAEHASQTEVISQHSVEGLIHNHCKLFLETLWNDLRSMMMKTSLDSISSIRDDVFEGLQIMERTSRAFDLSHLRKSVERIFANASAYDAARSTISELQGHSSQRTKEMKKRIREAQTEEKEKADRIESINKKIAELDERKKTLSIALEEEIASHLSTQKVIKDCHKELAKINEAFDEETYKSLKSSQSLLEAAQKALEDQNPFA